MVYSMNMYTSLSYSVLAKCHHNRLIQFTDFHTQEINHNNSAIHLWLLTELAYLTVFLRNVITIDSFSSLTSTPRKSTTTIVPSTCGCWSELSFARRNSPFVKKAPWVSLSKPAPLPDSLLRADLTVSNTERGRWTLMAAAGELEFRWWQCSGWRTWATATTKPRASEGEQTLRSLH